MLILLRITLFGRYLLVAVGACTYNVQYFRILFYPLVCRRLPQLAGVVRIRSSNLPGREMYNIMLTFPSLNSQHYEYLRY